jgi:hypothetical protein
MTLFQFAIVVVTLVLVSASWATAGKDVLLSSDFEQDPQAAGWRTGADKGTEFEGAWAEADPGGQAGPASAGRYLLAGKGWWQTPALPVTPFEYYRLRFRALAQVDGYWTAEFFDAAGKQLDADCYDSLPSGRQWQAQERCFRANADAATVRVRFIALRKPVRVDDVSIERIARPAAAAWADGVYATLPPLHYTPPEGRWALLPKTMARLRNGPSLRVVLLGDSIANDTSHSSFDVLLERAYPACRVEVVNSVRGGTGCRFYQDDNRVEPYVLRFKPDLLIVAGISHGYDAAAIDSVIRQVRVKSDCEVMVMTGAVCPREQCETNAVDGSDLPKDEACRVVEQFPARLAAVAAAQKAEFFDIRPVWDDYVRPAPHPQVWFMRDSVHANVRGKQALGRILLRYFQP